MIVLSRAQSLINQFTNLVYQKTVINLSLSYCKYHKCLRTFSLNLKKIVLEEIIIIKFNNGERFSSFLLFQIYFCRNENERKIPIFFLSLKNQNFY
jgi:hypothetical protein